MSIKLPFLRFKDKQEQEKNEVKEKNIPDHVAIIMDGNGRWAKKRGLPRVAGHKEGMEAVQNVVRSANKFHISTLTLFAFSTENWQRPKSEVDFLMRMPSQFFQKYLPELLEKNVRVETIGDFDRLPEHTKKAVVNAKEQTKNNDGLLLNFALNYGGRLDIVQAVRKVAAEVEGKRLLVEEIDDQLFNDYLFTKGMAEPDLLIRTSGEKRISNFMLWQCAYSEFWFTDVLWPDFDEKVFIEAINAYQQRKRRFGTV
ncbi:isoprenyl transferase [Virgibacillus sp. 179-BFC.A HS]|uniref:Isoprenyl transferase n=1 Tax=Tigheibacillus jepli TaxID=3035914 RepID=A0ABU5CI20_9BACI|nr:isoprenyl transferase [Virgibacillus sp. 179-BFC.A HS]MDY0405860.1 isoprenyl transferase [Virgibacillus sp. 179-BFC.A HS]